MQLFTPRELQIFKNFQSIEPSMRIGPDMFATMGPSNAEIAYYLWDRPEDEFAPFYIFNGATLINAITLHDTDKIETTFTTSQVVLSSPDTESAVTMAKENMVKSPKHISYFMESLFSTIYAKFTLTSENLKNILKATSVMKADIIRMEFNKSSVKLSTRVKDDVTSDTYSKTIPCITELAPKYFIDVKKLGVLFGEDDYDIIIGAGKNTNNHVMHCISTTDTKLNYLIGCEPKRGK